MKLMNNIRRELNSYIYIEKKKLNTAKHKHYWDISVARNGRRTLRCRARSMHGCGNLLHLHALVNF